MKNKDINPGVKCQVDECVYNVSGDLCSATKIEVATKHAKGAHMADCLTFEPGESDLK